MLKVITEAQKLEIEKFAEKYADTLTAYGADMYRQGIIASAVVIGVTEIAFWTIEFWVKTAKARKKLKSLKEGS